MKKQEKIKVITRMAPSPTGLFHIGGARTALYNYLFAKQNNGEFILRIEDTDKERSKLKWEKNIKTSLTWLNLKWDREYKQSKRLNIYKKYLNKLVKSERVYKCYCTEKELDKMRKEQESRGVPPKYIGKCRNLKNDNQREKHVLRFKVNNKIISKACFSRFARKIEFKDLIRGKLKFDTNLIGDFIIAKSLDEPLYNFANVIDDAQMQISHVIRGEEHLSNTPRQIIIYNALNLKIPKFAHLPLILGSDRSKMSKRHGAVSIEHYKNQGYLSEALINFMALLGWNPGQGSTKEIFSIKELIKQFTLQKVQKAGAVFNLDKLNWMNREYIKKLDFQTYKNKIPKSKFTALQRKQITKLIFNIEKERAITLNEIGQGVEFLFKDKLNYDSNLLKWKDMDNAEIKSGLETVHKALFSLSEKNFTKENLEKMLLPLSEELGKTAHNKFDRGKLLWPLRVALTGEKNSPGPFEAGELLGKKKALDRIQSAAEKL
ncbi:glutamate--tRNA ligase [bacterium]|nr:glutamate--tRNA ligase [bacterium]|tara:strand:+ start:5252 stop:6721 length:1470 start_codon:yes stop_codon:yes gene_type:complete